MLVTKESRLDQVLLYVLRGTLRQIRRLIIEQLLSKDGGDFSFDPAKASSVFDRLVTQLYLIDCV
jgi:hypothetical protein